MCVDPKPLSHSHSNYKLIEELDPAEDADTSDKEDREHRAETSSNPEPPLI